MHLSDNPRSRMVKSLLFQEYGLRFDKRRHNVYQAVDDTHTIHVNIFFMKNTKSNRMLICYTQPTKSSISKL